MSTTTVPSKTNTSTQQPPETEQPAGRPIIRAIRPKDLSPLHETISLLTEDNWESWRQDILLIFRLCYIDKYVDGTLKCPDSKTDPESYKNCIYNDIYARKVIRDRLSEGQKIYASNVAPRLRCGRVSWQSINPVAIKPKNQLMRELTDMKAREGDDTSIHKHLTGVKKDETARSLSRGVTLSHSPNLSRIITQACL
jgi:hypothetical protein